MARIRSIHPGFFLDNAFISSFARLLFLGLGSYADDAGIFEWKPKHLKLQILPNDRVNIDKLFSELEREGMIESYQVDGKKYGLIRNFTKWQKPKNPVYKYPSKDVQMHADCVSDVDQTLVNCGSDVGQAHASPEKDNKNNMLQKKLSTGRGEEEKEESRVKKDNPQTPFETEQILQPKPVKTEQEELQQATHTLSQISGVKIEQCEIYVQKWLSDLNGNISLLLHCLDQGMAGTYPINYTRSIVQRYVTGNQAIVTVLRPQAQKEPPSRYGFMFEQKGRC